MFLPYFVQGIPSELFELRTTNGFLKGDLAKLDLLISCCASERICFFTTLHGYYSTGLRTRASRYNFTTYSKVNDICRCSLPFF